MNEYPFSGKTRISIIWPKGEKVCRIRWSKRIKQEIFSHGGSVFRRQTCVQNMNMPESPDWIPPQYTVQFWGLDWFTTSSNLSCFEPSERRQKTKQINSHVSMSMLIRVQNDFWAAGANWQIIHTRLKDPFHLFTMIKLWFSCHLWVKYKLCVIFHKRL